MLPRNEAIRRKLAYGILIASAPLYHCKKLKVDLTQENVVSVALWFHLGPGSGPPPVAMVKGYTPFPVKNSSKT